MMPKDRLEIDFVLESADKRAITLRSYGPVSDALLEELCKTNAK